MKKIYVVERMPETAYNRMRENIFYAAAAEVVEVEAENEMEAFYKAFKPGYAINKNYIKTKKEIEAIKKAEQEAEEAKKKKEEAAKARRKANEEKKAKEAGMTVQQYRHEKRKEARIKKIQRQIEEMMKEIERIKNE